MMRSASRGKVYLVGAGPGDPDLLTLRASRLIASASCILHDDLVSGEILSLAGPHAIVRNVGKRCGRKCVAQSDIHQLMIDFAAAGHEVLRLKGGDPVLYGRAGEEMDALQKAGIPFEIVPGITAASTAAAVAAVSLTDRRAASRVLFTTGHHASPEQRERCSYSEGTTLARYMPGRDYGRLQDVLIESGWPSEAECLIVSCAGRTGQQIRRTILGELDGLEPLPPPAILLVLPRCA